jgi:hypothetical protein
VTDQGYSRGLLFIGREKRIDYLKVDGDERTKGSNNVQQHPIYEGANICVGILVCKDVENDAFSTKVIEHVKSSRALHKLVCIPTDMASHWFREDALWTPKYGGVNVVLCNHIKTHQVRCKSFVTDREGRKAYKQHDTTPLYAEVP